MRNERGGGNEERAGMNGETPARVPVKPAKRGGRMSDQPAVEEVPVWLEVNGAPLVTWMCTPDLLEELAIGWLGGGGYIQSIDEGHPRAGAAPPRPPARPPAVGGTRPPRGGGRGGRPRGAGRCSPRAAAWSTSFSPSRIR